MISSRESVRVDSSQKNFKSLNLYNNHVFAPQVKIFRCITFMAPNTDPSYPLNCLYWNISIFLKGKLNISKLALKVLANEKRGGLRVELFDRSPFKLFSLKFSLKFSMKKCVETARNRSWFGLFRFEPKFILFVSRTP